MMDGDGNIRTFGQFIRYNGRLYSNLHHVDTYGYRRVSPMQTAFLPTVDDYEDVTDKYGSFDEWYRAKRMNRSRTARRVV